MQQELLLLLFHPDQPYIPRSKLPITTIIKAIAASDLLDSIYLLIVKQMDKHFQVWQAEI